MIPFRKARISTEIPTASMPDVVFMLLLFFMVSTVFRDYVGLPVHLPETQRIDKLDAKKNVIHIHATANHELEVNGHLIQLSELYHLAHSAVRKNPRLIVSLKIDRDVSMQTVYDIQEALRKAGALRVNYNTLLKNELTS